MRTLLHVAMIVATVPLLAEQRPKPAARGGLVKQAVNMTCAAVLGAGVKTDRDFCDVIIGGDAKDSITAALPAHTGTATVTIDLHNRFTVPGSASTPPMLAYARHQAAVSVIAPSGDVLGRAIVAREFRTDANLFDKITGGAGPGGVKSIAPGPVETVEFTVPANVSSIGIVGTRLKVLARVGGEQVFDTPGRPIAIVSRVQVEYRAK
jgi:hypothetical protein